MVKAIGGAWERAEAPTASLSGLFFKFPKTNDFSTTLKALDSRRYFTGLKEVNKILQTMKNDHLDANNLINQNICRI